MLYKPGYVELLDYSVNTWRSDTAWVWVQTESVRPPGEDSNRVGAAAGCGFKPGRYGRRVWVQTGSVRPPGEGKGVVFRPKGDRR